MIHQFSAAFDLAPQSSVGIASADFRSDIEADHPLIQQHDDQSPDLVTAHRLAREFVYTGGADINVYLRTENASADQVWDEDPDPTYWSPINCKAFFEPQALQLALTQWSAEAPIVLEIIFAHQDVLVRLGRMLRYGDVVRIPYNAVGNISPRDFKILNAAPYGNHRYHWLYVSCTAENLSGDHAIQVDPRPFHPLGGLL